MSEALYYVGDVFDVMRRLPDGSADLVLTSPPFLALRSYLPADHPDKAKEIGSEPTPAEFLDTLLALTAEWGRLLAPHGSLCVELGDSYAGGSSLGTDGKNGSSRYPTARPNAEIPKSGNGWPLDKSLCIIPELYAACLAYGRNVLTGEESPAGQWRVRNLVRWVRPNPPVGALGDKFRPATSVMTVACKARDRWFDLDDVRTINPNTDYEADRTQNMGKVDKRERARAEVGLSSGNGWTGMNPAGAPPVDWWNIPTEPYSGSHYATWPRKLCERPIRSMCPQEVCRVCGEPRRRVVGDTEEYAAFKAKNQWESGGKVTSNLHRPDMDFSMPRVQTLGWTDCGHDDYRRGIVLDPFAGSGTTLAVATGLGRDAWGIDLDARNAELARERVGMFLTVVEHDDRDEAA